MGEFSILGGVAGLASGYASDKVSDKLVEWKDLLIRDPKLIQDIENTLCEKYENELFYNHLTEYLQQNDTIATLVKRVYGAHEYGTPLRDDFINQNSNRFFEKYECSITDRSIVKDAFKYIYDTVYSKLTELSPHSDIGKLQIGLLAQEEQRQSEHNEMMGMLRLLVDQVSAATVNPSTIPVKCDDLSEKAKALLKEVEGVGTSANAVKNDEEAIAKYTELLAKAAMDLRREDDSQFDRVLCSVNCRIAMRYSNMGNTQKAFECLDTTSQSVREHDKVYHYVYAVIVINHRVDDKYEEAKLHLDKALELDIDYLLAFFAQGLLFTRLREKDFDEIRRSFDDKLNAAEHDNQKDTIAECYMYYSLACLETQQYEEAIKNINSAVEYGYEEKSAAYNIAIAYYSMATSEYSKDEDIVFFECDIQNLRKVVEISQKWLLSSLHEYIPNHLKVSWIGVYVSACGLIGINHGLIPLSDYTRLPGISYNVLRMLLLCSGEELSEDEIALLNEKDRISAKISNCIKADNHITIVEMIAGMSDEEIASLPQPTVHVFLQACVMTGNITKYHKYRDLLPEDFPRALVEFLDAYAYEKEGDIQKAKEIIDQIVVSTTDYPLLNNIANFYMRNQFNAEAEQLFVRLLDMKKSALIYVEDLSFFYSRAITFLSRIKSEYVENYVKEFEEVEEQDISILYVLHNYFYVTKDYNRMLPCIESICHIEPNYQNLYNRIVCLIRLLRYEEALGYAHELYSTLTEKDLSEKDQMILLISTIYLYAGDRDNSFVWAGKAHELFIDTPSHHSHQHYLAHALITGHQEALPETMQYKQTHPVVTGEWFKEVRIPEDGNIVDALLQATKEISGEDPSEAKRQEQDFMHMYKSGLLSNSMLLRYYGFDFGCLFAYAMDKKLAIASGSVKELQEDISKINDTIYVDALTLIIMFRHNCLDALEQISEIRICYSSIIQLQAWVCSMTGEYAFKVLEWIRNNEKICCVADSLTKSTIIEDYFLNDTWTCIYKGEKEKIPFVTVEPNIKQLQALEEIGIPKDLEAISVPALCRAYEAHDSKRSSEMLYNLMLDCGFISFIPLTMLYVIEKDEFNIVETSLERFFCCNTSCDMISFANVYLGVIRELCRDHFDCAVIFALLTLENGIKVWRRGEYYRMLVSSGRGDEITKIKVDALDRYLLYLNVGIKGLFEDMPEQLEEKYTEVSKIIAHQFGQKVLREWQNC